MKWVEGTVIDQKEWAPGLFSIFVEAPILPFIAGQFTQLSLDITDHRLQRPYSFVNAPPDPILEFYYDHIEHGHLTPSMIHLKKGDRLWVAQKAAGRFVLNTVPNGKILWMLATGTGLGVFLSLLKTDEPWQRFERIVLVHSVRRGESLTHQPLIKSWQQNYSEKFHWIPVVTREPYPNTFSERLTELLKFKKLEESLNLEILPQTSHVMLCGNPAMVNEVCQILGERGLIINRRNGPGQITFENYWKL